MKQYINHSILYMIVYPNFVTIFAAFLKILLPVPMINADIS